MMILDTPKHSPRLSPHLFSSRCPLAAPTLSPMLLPTAMDSFTLDPFSLNAPLVSPPALDPFPSLELEAFSSTTTTTTSFSFFSGDEPCPSRPFSADQPLRKGTVRKRVDDNDSIFSTSTKQAKHFANATPGGFPPSFAAAAAAMFSVAFASAMARKQQVDTTTSAVPVPTCARPKSYRDEVARQLRREREAKRQAALDRIGELEAQAAEEARVASLFSDSVPIKARRAIKGKVPKHLSHCNPTVVNLARGKISQKSVMSCHQCKSRKEAKELSFCATDPSGTSALKKRMCRKKYCESCLRRYYGLDVPNQAEWYCPGCKGVCVCKACRSARTRDDLPEPKPTADGTVYMDPYTPTDEEAKRDSLGLSSSALPLSVAIEYSSDAKKEPEKTEDHGLLTWSRNAELPVPLPLPVASRQLSFGIRDNLKEKNKEEYNPRDPIHIILNQQTTSPKTATDEMTCALQRAERLRVEMLHVDHIMLRRSLSRDS